MLSSVGAVVVLFQTLLAAKYFERSRVWKLWFLTADAPMFAASDLWFGEGFVAIALIVVGSPLLWAAYIWLLATTASPEGTHWTVVVTIAVFVVSIVYCFSPYFRLLR
jgi:hypothetical protein